MGAEKKELKKILSELLKHNNFDRIEFAFPEDDTSGGCIADMVFVTVIGFKKEKKHIFNVIVKSAKTSEEGYYGEACANEVCFYSKVLPEMKKFAEEKNVTPFSDVPFCYGVVSEKQKYVIFLENMKTKGYKMHDVKKTLDLDHTKKVLETCAVWHAFCFALRDQNRAVFENLAKYSEGIENSKLVNELIEYYLSEIDNVLHLYKDKAKPKTVEKLENLKQNCSQIINDCLTNKNEDFVVLTHGDCWNNNILFHYDETTSKPDQVILIDWQLSSKATPLVDVVQLLFWCCSREELQDIDELLKFYHDSLSQKMRELGSDAEKCFPWEVCKKSFRRYAPVGILAMPVCAKVAFTRNDIEIKISNSQTTEKPDQDSTFNLSSDISQPDQYFNRIDGILDLCIERGYL